MATTTATFSLRSSDLIPSQVLSLTTSKRLYKAGSSSEGVDHTKIGRHKLATGTNFDLFNASALGVDKSNYIYIANATSGTSNYVVVTIIDEIIGRLYSGDFMWLPCNFDGATSDIEVESVGGEATIDYAIFHEGETLGTAG